MGVKEVGVKKSSQRSQNQRSRSQRNRSQEIGVRYRIERFQLLFRERYVTWVMRFQMDIARMGYVYQGDGVEMLGRWDRNYEDQRSKI